MGELLPNCCLVKPSEESPGAGLTRRPFPCPFTPSGPFRRRCRKHQSFSLRWNKRNIFCLSAKLERPGVALCKHRLFAVTVGMTVGKSILFFSLPDAPAPHGAGPARPPEHLEARPRTRGAVPPQPSGREAGSASVVLLWLPVRRGWPGCQHRNRGGRLAPSFLRCLLEPRLHGRFCSAPAHGGDSDGPGVTGRQKLRTVCDARPAAQRLLQGGPLGPAGSLRAGPGPRVPRRALAAQHALGYQLNSSDLAPGDPVPAAKYTEAAIGR